MSAIQETKQRFQPSLEIISSLSHPKKQDGSFIFTLSLSEDPIKRDRAIVSFALSARWPRVSNQNNRSTMPVYRAIVSFALSARWPRVSHRNNRPNTPVCGLCSTISLQAVVLPEKRFRIYSHSPIRNFSQA